MAAENQSRRLAVRRRLQRAKMAGGRQSRWRSIAGRAVLVGLPMALGRTKSTGTVGSTAIIQSRLWSGALMPYRCREFVDALVIDGPTCVRRGETDNASFACKNTTLL